MILQSTHTNQSRVFMFSYYLFNLDVSGEDHPSLSPSTWPNPSCPFHIYMPPHSSLITHHSHINLVSFVCSFSFPLRHSTPKPESTNQQYKTLIPVLQEMGTTEAQQFTIDFEETELRLGLPIAKGAAKPDSEAAKNFNIYGKRGFMETVDLKLNLSSKESTDDKSEKTMNDKKAADLAKPPAK